MSINLTLEKPETALEEKPAVRYTKRIDDLIEDAEIEAEIEAERKIRAKNTKIVAISAVAAGLLGLLYFGISYQTAPPSPATVDSPEIAMTPPAVTPKPIPFPVNSKQDKQPDETPMVKKDSGTITAPAAPAPSASRAKPVAKAESPAPVTSKKPSQVRGTTLQAMKLPPSRSLNEPSKPAKSFQQPAGPAKDSGYFVQVGAFSNKANAERLVKKLDKAGFSSAVRTKAVRQKTVHVVSVGGYPDASKAREAQVRLGQKGYKKTFTFFSKSG